MPARAVRRSIFKSIGILQILAILITTAAPFPIIFSAPQKTYANAPVAGAITRIFLTATGTQMVGFDNSAIPNEAFWIAASPYSQVDVAAEGFQPHVPFATADQGLQLGNVDLFTTDHVEVSFEKNGYSYQVVMESDGDRASLMNILKTWQFD